MQRAQAHNNKPKTSAVTTFYLRALLIKPKEQLAVVILCMTSLTNSTRCCNQVYAAISKVR